MDAATLQAQITATQSQLDKLNANFLGLVDMTVAEYTLDTGQTIERVKRHDIDAVLKAIDSLTNRLATLCARQSGGASVQAFPVSR